MESYISDMLSPEGWLEWNGTPVNLDTLYYAEYKNHGPGAGVENRVKWSGYHVLTDPIQASNFTVVQLILGNQWLPATDVPFTPGLGN
jgi:pectinesterase